jgi:hypothetical protein
MVERQVLDEVERVDRGVTHFVKVPLSRFPESYRDATAQHSPHVRRSRLERKSERVGAHVVDLLRPQQQL